MAAELLSERRAGTLLLTLQDDAARNALSEAVLSAGVEALNVAEGDRSVRCIVLQGAGGHFCAGGNLNGLTQRRQAGAAAQTRMLGQLNQFIESLRACPKPIVAAVEGAAAGAGFSIALACDMIVAAADARFVLSYARLGLSPDGGATLHLARAMPLALAKELLWLAESIASKRLHELGIVNSVVGRGEALAGALQLAERLAEMAPNALASTKVLLERAHSSDLAQQLDAEADHLVRNLFHDNGGEGLKAFFEKRKPRFQ